jgi:hypothetical protein
LCFARDSLLRPEVGKAQPREGDFPLLYPRGKIGRTLGGMGHDIAATSIAWKEKRMALKATRDSLFKEYSKRPQDYHLALEIKTIDDEIAECNEKEQEGNERSKVRRQRTLVGS